MSDSRFFRAKLNIVVSLATQAVTILCGLIVPGLMIGAFGSETYGAVASITQFLAYITLLEGGIGGVARAALYKPLVENNIERISQIVVALKRFFRVIMYIFAAYVIILAVFFHKLADVQCLDWISTAVLVVVISISTFAQYFIGISYAVLIQASQRTYITNIISISTTVLNTVLIVLLVNVGSNIIIVKLVSSMIFVLRPVFMMLYVKKKFKLVKCSPNGENLLPQKWTGLGQHVAFFLHSNTDIAILTVFSQLSTVSVYSVYNMITSHIQQFTASFSTGMEALFGDMIAKNEKKELSDTFGYYETLISAVTTVLFSTTAVMIIPFVKLYTRGVTDANYIYPLFAILLILSSVAYCLRIPYHSVVIAAGHFKQTKIAAYGEAIINIVLSMVLLIKLGLVGVAIGTLVAVVFRFVFYIIYLSRHIMNRKLGLFVKRLATNVIILSLSFVVGTWVLQLFDISNYLVWVVSAGIVAVISVIFTLGINFVFYYKDLSQIVKKRILKK